MKKSVCFFLLYATTVAISLAQTGFPLDVTINVAPPYPVRLSDYTDIGSQVFINVNNPTGNTYEIIFQGTLENLDRAGISIRTNASNPPTQCLTVFPGLNNFAGSDLGDLFDPSHLIISGVDLTTIQGDRALPEGRYRLCLRAYNCFNSNEALSPAPTLISGCAELPNAYVDPPVITMPICGETINSDLAAITFNWLFMPPVGGVGNTEFRFRMVEIDPPGRNPFNAMQTATAPYLLDEAGIPNNNYNLLTNADVTLEIGKSYAYQVIAYDPDEEIQFRNNGASEVCWFTYGSDTDGFSFEPSFPLQGDYIPYDFFPFITKFAPYSESYIRFEGDFTLYEKQGGSYQEIDSRSSRNDWPRGPVTGQSSGGFTISEQEAQYLPVYKNLTMTPTPSLFQRGKEYAWQFDGEMNVQGGNPVSGNIPQVEFTVGMSPASQIAPANESTQEPGLINLQWTSAQAPSKVVPFNVSQWGRATDGTSLYNNTIDERWVLEVSKESSFDSIMYTANKRMQFDAVGSDEEGEITAALYGNMNREYEFTEEGTYYWRIKWLTDPADTVSEAYSISPIWNFTIGEPASPTPGIVEETPADCVSECLMAEITDETAVAIEVNTTIKMGKFNMKVTSITGSGSNQYSGEGEIAISFLNNVKVKVAFTNIKANAAGQIFTGKAKAMDDLPHISADSVSTIVNGLPVSIPDFNEAQSDAIEEVFETGERLVSVIGGSRPMGMPLGFDKEIDDYRFVIGITEMHFLPRKADITAVARIDIPALGEKLPAFGAKGVCITPGGLGDEYALYLARDHEIVTAGDFKFVFNGNMAGDTTKASYIEFDCTGFKCVRLAGTVTIPGDKLIAENDDRTINEEGHVEGTFAFKGCRGKNFIGSIGFSAFQIKGMKGWGFKPITAYLDWSDIENPPGFAFPENYDVARLSDSTLLNTWKGFYLKELSMHAPLEFDKKIAGDVSVNVENVIIDGSGITGSVNVRNLVDYDDGEVEGWAFSLDSIGFGVVQGNFTGGGFKGKLGTPIFNEEDFLHYNAALIYVDDSVNYNFRVFAKDTLGMDIWKAKVTLHPDSQILFKGGTNVETELSMDLNGTVTIEGDVGVPQLSLPGIEFQALHLSTKDQFSIGHFSFTSPQKSAAGFPVNINDIGFSGGFSSPALDFDVGLTLSNAGFSAEVGFEIIGETYTNSSDQIRLRYDRTRLDAISIDQTMDGGIKIAGSLQFYQEDPVYGNGMRGDVSVMLPMELGIDVAVQFGTLRSDNSADFNTAGYFSYWYIDGLVSLPAGVPLFPGFAAYGFGGGAYHHMQPSSPPSASDAEGTLSAGASGGRSTTVYTPDFETLLGLKATVVVATTPSKETFNMDVTLAAQFNNHGGLDTIGIEGKGFIMTKISERENAKVRANIAIGYANDSDGGKRVSGNFDVFVRIGEILYGIGTGAQQDRLISASIFADSDKWHFYMGEQEEGKRGGVKVDLQLPIHITLSTYLMVGHGIPTSLPPLPDKIRELVYGPQQQVEGKTSSSDINGREMAGHLESQLNRGKGFAMGAHLELSTRLDFAIFYASLELWLGFDLNISQDSLRVCYETGEAPGINDWYGTGQFYAGMEGELGIQVNLWFVKGEFPIINLAAAFALQGGLPNPAWMEGRAGLRYRILGGLIKGHCNFKAQIGEKCSYVDPNPFSNIEFISGFSPDHGDDDVSVFIAPQVSFALPVNEMLELPAGLEDEPEKMRTFYPFVATGRTTLRDLKNNQNVAGVYQGGTENVTGSFQPYQALEAQADHRFEVAVRAQEYFPNGTNALVKVDGSVWEEVKNVTFKSGDRPDVIVESQVAYTYPINKQAYFLKNETRNGKGLLKYLGAGQNYLFEEVDEEGNPYTFFARYIKLDDDSGSRGEISLGRDKLSFDVPSNLENSSIYGVQFIRKDYEAPTTRLQQLAEQVGNSNLVQAAPSATILQAFALTDNRGQLTGITADVRTTEVELLPTETVRSGEKILYSFHFRTSQFNTLQEKLGQVAINPTYYYYNGSLFEHVKLGGRMEEPFDEFEVNGVFKNGNKVLNPFLSFMDRHSNAYFRNRAEYYVYDLRNELRRLNGQRSIKLPGVEYIISLPDFNSTRDGQSIFNVMPFNTMILSSSSDIGAPLADWEMDKAAGINEYAIGGLSVNAATTASSSSGASSGISSSGMIGNTNFSVSSFTSGVNAGSSNLSSYSGTPDFGASGSSATQNFNLIHYTSMYVKLDAMQLQRRLSHWMATNHRIMGGIITLERTNAETLISDNPTLYSNIMRFITLPLSAFHYTNGNYQYVIRYKYPGSYVATRITKSFNINYHDESIH